MATARSSSTEAVVAAPRTPPAGKQQLQLPAGKPVVEPDAMRGNPAGQTSGDLANVVEQQVPSSAAKVGSEAAEEAWKLGGFKSAAKWESQMAKRGWTPQQISEAMHKGEKLAAENLVNKGNAASRFVHPETGRSVVIDEVTKEVIHVGGDDFKY